MEYSSAMWFDYLELLWGICSLTQMLSTAPDVWESSRSAKAEMHAVYLKKKR